MLKKGLPKSGTEILIKMVVKWCYLGYFFTMELRGKPRAHIHFHFINSITRLYNCNIEQAKTSVSIFKTSWNKNIPKLYLLGWTHPEPIHTSPGTSKLSVRQWYSFGGLPLVSVQLNSTFLFIHSVSFSGHLSPTSSRTNILVKYLFRIRNPNFRFLSTDQACVVRRFGAWAFWDTGLLILWSQHNLSNVKLD